MNRRNKIANGLIVLGLVAVAVFIITTAWWQ